MVVVTELFLYISFSLLMGGLLVQAIPSGKLPEVKVPKKLLLTCVVLIALLSFGPVLQVVLYLGADIGYWKTFYFVLFTFEVGKAWLITIAIAILLYCLIYFNDLNRDPILARMGVALAIILVIALGWASHASSLTPWSGFIAHSFHFLAVTVWTGVMITVGWFSTSENNWLQFQRWFTPLAIGCVAVVIAAGLVLMELILTDGYFYSWLVPYGQAILFKHLLIIPLLTYAFINGFLMKARLKKDPSFSPRKWLKVESVIVLLVFSATAFMGQQSPPHDVETLLEQQGPASWFAAFYQGSFQPTMNVVFHFGTVSFLFSIVAFVFLALVLFSYIKKAPSWLSLLMSVLFVFAGYIGLMTAIQ